MIVIISTAVIEKVSMKAVRNNSLFYQNNFLLINYSGPEMAKIKIREHKLGVGVIHNNINPKPALHL